MRTESEEEQSERQVLDVCFDVTSERLTIERRAPLSRPVTPGRREAAMAAAVAFRASVEAGDSAAIEKAQRAATVALYDLCPVAFRWLRAYAFHHAPACVQVRVRSHGDALSLPWELLWLGDRPDPDAEHLPAGEFAALTGAVSVVRELPGVLTRTGSVFGAGELKILLLVGDHRQPTNTFKSWPSIEDTVEAIQAAVSDVGGHASVTVAASEDYPGRKDKVLHGQSPVAEQLGEWLPAFDAVHFVGHSDADFGPATELRFGGECDPLTPTDFASALQTARRPRLVVLHACRTLDYVTTDLLEAVDHVVTMQTMVTPRIARALCEGLYGELATGARIGRAMFMARKSIAALIEQQATADLATNWWVPALWSAVHGDPKAVDPQRARLVGYLESVVKAHGDLHRIRPKAHDSAIEQIPVAVHVRDARPNVGSDRPSDADEQVELAERHRALTLADLLARGLRRWAVEGKPGYGKTTSMRHLARRLALRCIAELHGVQPEGEARGVPPLVPLFIALRHQDGCGDGSTKGFIRTAVGADFRDDEELLADLTERLVDGQVACLIDGLDEVVEEAKRQVATDLCTGLAGSGRAGGVHSAVLVTTRPAGFDGLAAYDSASLEELSPDQRRELLAGWGRLSGNQDPDGFARLVLKAASGSGALEELTGIPLFLVLMAVEAEKLQSSGQPIRFAAKRHEFFRDLLDTLALTDHRPKELRSPLEPRRQAFKLLADIARKLSERGALRADLDTVADWIDGRAELKKWEDDPERFLVEVATKTAIFAPPGGSVERGSVEYEFLHRSFQEALTAKALFAEHSTPEAGARWVGELVAREGGELEAWREPIALMAAHYGKLADSFLSSLLDDEATRKIGLAALACAEAATLETLEKALAGSEDLEERLIVYQGLTDRFGRGAEAIPMLRARILGADVEERWHLDQVLAVLEDGSDNDASSARSELLVLPGRKEQEDREELRRLLGEVPGHPGEALWCPIEPGEFWMGSPEGEKGRIPERERQFKAKIEHPFWMGVVPVTTEQFALFSPKDPRFSGDHLPMNTVSWFDAALYCRWLTERLRTFRTRAGYGLPGLEHSGELEARLPSEAEWEFAARAGTTGPFSSGTELTEKVAVFNREWRDGPDVVGGAPADPRTKNLAGLWDVHGNIREWCADWFGAYPEVSTEESAPACLWRPPPSGSARVLRGGCFFFGPRGCRSAYRDCYRPGSALRFFGFRVVLAAPVLGPSMFDH